MLKVAESRISHWDEVRFVTQQAVSTILNLLEKMMNRTVRSQIVTISTTLAAFLCAAILAQGTPQSQPAFTTLQPGGFRNIQQTLQVNLVFVGFTPGNGSRQIDETAFRGELSQTYKAIERNPDYYGIRNFVGTEFNYSYNFVFADSQFENALFGYLASISQPMPRTAFQDAYNEQNAKTLSVDQNHWIDAPSVEKWLADNAGSALGVNTAQYTVFFINWYGRSDFRFHVYTKTDEPDTDTHTNIGALRDSRKMIAWGGTSPNDEEGGLGSLHRIWFYDLSAGPEAWTGNFDVDTADLNGDEVLDYRMPPIWEYGNLSGYRPFDNLSGDLGKVTRYVAIDLLFTTSPLFSPAITPPRLPSDIELDVNLYQGDRSTNARDLFSASVLRQEVNELQPFNHFTSEVSDLAFTRTAKRVYKCFLAGLVPPYVGTSCYGNRLGGYGLADLYLYHSDHLFQFLEGDGDYEVPIFVYNTTAEDTSGGLQGYSDDNWSDGTQTFVYVFEDPISVESGFGITDTTIHEVGHHLGMSHTHDGYDHELDYDFSAYDGEFAFTWSGDQSNSVMSYLFTNNDFSQFDRDNMNRYMTATYINQANAILPYIHMGRRAHPKLAQLTAADAYAANALTAYSNMDYTTAVESAKLAYQLVADTASINVINWANRRGAAFRTKELNFRTADPKDGLRLNLP